MTLAAWSAHVGRVGTEPEFSRTLREMTVVVQDNMKAEAPVDTGFLRKNIVRRGNQLNRSIVGRAYYTKFVVEGTRFIGANEFDKRGLERSQGAIRRATEVLAKDLGGKIARK